MARQLLPNCMQASNIDPLPLQTDSTTPPTITKKSQISPNIDIPGLVKACTAQPQACIGFSLGLTTLS